MAINAIPPYVPPVEHSVQIENGQLNTISFDEAVANLQKRETTKKVESILTPEEDPNTEEEILETESDVDILINPEKKGKDPLFEYNEDEVDSKLEWIQFRKRKELEMWKDILNNSIYYIGKLGNKSMSGEKENCYDIQDIDKYEVELDYRQYYFSGGEIEPMAVRIRKGDDIINIDFYSEDFFKIYINGEQVGQYGSESNNKLILNPDVVKNKIYEILKIIKSKGENIRRRMIQS